MLSSAFGELCAVIHKLGTWVRSDFSIFTISLVTASKPYPILGVGVYAPKIF